MSNKSDSRRQHDRRKKYDDTLFASPEAAEAVEEASEPTPTPAPEPGIEARFTYSALLGAQAVARRLDCTLEDIAAECGEGEIRFQNVFDAKEIIEARIQRLAEQAKEVPVEELAGPTLGERIRGFFSGIRLPNVQLPRMDRSQWFTGGMALLAMIALIILAVSTFHPRGLVHLALTSPAPTAEPTPVEEVVVVTKPVTPTVQTVAVVPTAPVSPTMAITTTAPVTSTVIDTITTTVTITVPVEVEPEIAVEPVVTVVTVTPTMGITGTIANASARGLAIELVREGEDEPVDVVATSPEGTFGFAPGRVPKGKYDLRMEGLVTPVMVEVREGEPLDALSLHKVVEKDTLWDMYGPQTWERFEEMAEELGLKWFVNDGDTPDDTMDDLLVIIIQPGQVFDLDWAPSG